MVKSQELIDKVAQSCLNLYNNLSKNGKPTVEEWTVLSCVAKHVNNQGEDDIEVVSLGTGSKCIGASKMCPLGLVLNDSHAEVCARRGFLLYLYHQIDRTLSNKSSIFLKNNEKLILQDNITFYFFSSQLPCGDASIILKESDEEQFGNVIVPLKRLFSQDTSSIKENLTNDIHRTGAKCLPDDNQDPRLPGKDYHVLGQVRTKPGRGDRTLSVSCSDKIAKWVHMGIQGRLLSILLHDPICINHFIFGFGTPFSIETLERAIIKRNDLNPIFIETVPEFYQSNISFPDMKSACKTRPAPGSILWFKLDKPVKEVAVLGKKLGATKKETNAMKNILSISKYNLYKVFLYTISKSDYWKNLIADSHPLDSLKYNEVKKKSIVYNEKWMMVKRDFFKTWTSKPDMWDFSIKCSSFLETSFEIS